jgi:LysM repeat protein
MPRKDSPQSVIDSYRKRQRSLPFIIGGLAVLLVLIGVVIIVLWISGPSSPKISLFPTVTPTVTLTYTPTPEPPTETPTMPPTETIVPSPTLSLTPSGPFEYTIQEQDNCWDIAVKFKVDLPVLLAINNFVGCPIHPGQKILIPAPGQKLPTATDIPADLPRGTKIDYYIQLGDTLAGIAAKFNTTMEQIMTDNKIQPADANKIQVGQKLVIKVNLVTPTKTFAPTSTSGPGKTVTPTHGVTVNPVTIIPESTNTPAP